MNIAWENRFNHTRENYCEDIKDSKKSSKMSQNRE